jgi:hypothetical protein
MQKTALFLVFSFITPFLFAQNVQVQVDILAKRKKVSPYIYGRNNSIANFNNNPLTAAQWQFLRDAGVRMFRENGGNNSTKYNWRRKLSSHPDWYNNVYANNWDQAAQILQANMPDAQGVWAFQLIGKAAKTGAANFNDWGYNGSQWWTGVNQNLAGGGTVNTAGGNKATVNGNPNLYLEDWPADSTTGILDHWFGTGGLGLNKDKIQYWNMDNEIEIWHGTHDDVMPTLIPAEEFMQRYFEVAKKARAKYPNIKLLGPVPANEWQWYNWSDGLIVGADGKKYQWLQYFIKRIAEEQTRTGVRLLDVLDIHFYPNLTTQSDVVQLHRIFFDRNYINPEANGVRNTPTGWDVSQNKEYIFGRCQDWLTQYMGANHGVKFGVTEIGLNENNSSTTHAVWYASTLGEFMNNEVELFTPWSWHTGMWEVLHLFSRYNQSTSVESISNNEQNLSVYTTINATNDSLTAVLVNRSTISQTVTVDFKNFIFNVQQSPALSLSGLPTTETFVSHTTNALTPLSTNTANNKIIVTLPALSVSSVLLKGRQGSTAISAIADDAIQVFPNPSSVGFSIKTSVEASCQVYDFAGKMVGSYPKGVQSFGKDWAKGSYVAVFSMNNETVKIVKLVKE